MPKKKSSTGSLKKPSHSPVKPAIEQTKQVPKPGKLGKEIDDIFGGKKKNKNSPASLNKSSQQVEKKPAVEQTTPAPKSGKVGKEIDDIFGGRKKKKVEKSEEVESKEVIAKRNRKRKRKEVDGYSKKPRKRTEDGFPVYTEAELRVNEGYAGGTHLCPFDCNCCF